jgi:hypothetical protein
MSTSFERTKLKLVYRQPSVLEGVSRIFDVPGIFRDEVSIRAPHHHRVAASKQSNVALVSSKNFETQAIQSAFYRVRQSMTAVAGRMRPLTIK